MSAFVRSTQKTNTEHKQSKPDGGEAWFRLFIAVLLSTIGGIGMWSVVLVLPEVQGEFGISRGDASLPYTATMIGFALGNAIVGRFADRLGIALPVITSAISLCAGFLLASQTTQVWQFTTVQGVFVGLGTSATFGPLIANISLWFERRRGIAVALAASGNYLSGAIWPILLQELIASSGWRTTYVVIGVICLFTMVPLSWFLRGEPPGRSVNRGANGVKAMAVEGRSALSPVLLQALLIVAAISCCVAMSMPQVHVLAYCIDLGYGAAVGAEILAIMLATGIISRVISGVIADHVGGVRTILLGSVLQCVALIFYLPFDGLASLYVVSFLFGLAQGGIVPSYALAVREYLPASEAGQRVGLVVMASILGMALGGWMSGWIFDQTGSYQAAFLNGIAWNFLNIIVMLMLLWRSGLSLFSTLRPVTPS